MSDHPCWSRGATSIQDCLFAEGFTFDDTDSHFVKGSVRIAAIELVGFTPTTFLAKAKKNKWLEPQEEVQLYSWGDQFMIAGMDWEDAD